MNAVHLKPPVSLKETIDTLVADHGLRSVLYALMKRTFRRSRPPDAGRLERLMRNAHVDGFDDRLREDIGLPPKEVPRAHVDMNVLFKRDIF